MEAWSRGRGSGVVAVGMQPEGRRLAVARGDGGDGRVERMGTVGREGTGGRRGPWGSGGGLQVAAVDVGVAGRTAASRIRVRRRPSARLSCAPAGCDARPSRDN